MSKHRDKLGESRLLDRASDRALTLIDLEARTAELNAEIRYLVGRGYSCRELGAMLGVSHQTVWKATQTKP